MKYEVGPLFEDKTYVCLEPFELKLQIQWEHWQKMALQLNLQQIEEYQQKS